MEGATMDDRLARMYRTNRREGMPARAAMYNARATIRGQELIGDAEVGAHPAMYYWELDIAPGVVVRVEAIHDETPCDCWHDWEKYGGEDEPEPEPHYHFGIVATYTVEGEEVAYDALWGFQYPDNGYWDYDAELAYAWEQVADPMIERATRDAASLPAWVRESLKIRACA